MIHTVITNNKRNERANENKYKGGNMRTETENQKPKQKEEEEEVQGLSMGFLVLMGLPLLPLQHFRVIGLLDVLVILGLLFLMDKGIVKWRTRKKSRNGINSDKKGKNNP